MDKIVEVKGGAVPGTAVRDIVKEDLGTEVDEGRGTGNVRTRAIIRPGSLGTVPAENVRTRASIRPGSLGTMTGNGRTQVTIGPGSLGTVPDQNKWERARTTGQGTQIVQTKVKGGAVSGTAVRDIVSIKDALGTEVDEGRGTGNVRTRASASRKIRPGSLGTVPDQSSKGSYSQKKPPSATIRVMDVYLGSVAGRKNMEVEEVLQASGGVKVIESEDSKTSDWLKSEA